MRTMRDITAIVAAAKRERAARAKAGKPFEGTLNVVIKNGIVTVDIAGFVNFAQYEELADSAELAGEELERIIVNINSGGGSAFAGVAIANLLDEIDAPVTTIAQSGAMSAAAVIFMAGDERLMGPKGSVLMFHRALGWIDVLKFGNRVDLEKVDVQAVKQKELDLLDSLDEIILESMTEGTKLDAKEAEAMMDAEKNIGKKLALKLGLATGVAGNKGKEKKDSSESGPAETENSAPIPDEEVAIVSSAYAILMGLEG